MSVLFILVLFTALLGAVYLVQQRQASLSKTVFIALVLGLIFGSVLQYFYAENTADLKQILSWVNIVGGGYVRLLQMIVMPLVLVSILSAVSKLYDVTALGKISFSILFVLLFTTAISALIGILFSALFHLNAEGLIAGARELAAQERVLGHVDRVMNSTIPEMLLSFIPRNPFAELTGANPTSIISVVIFSALLGMATLKVYQNDKHTGERLLSGIESLNKLIMSLVRIVISLTPYGILALMTNMAAKSTLSDILNLFSFILASYLAIATMFVIHGLLLVVNGINPLTYYKKVLPTLLFAFTSRSSAASIPLNIETQTNKLGNASTIANFSASFGATIGQNGCAGIYPAMLAVMIAPTIGIDPFTVDFILSLVVIITISSFGIAGVGGGATFAAIVVLSTMGLPLALVGLLISIEPIIDMARTALNVNGSITAGTLSSKWLGQHNQQIFKQMD
ncbi:L-cystine transporter [Mergibacter septicus]|uniref:L-cystine transporter n=1 Tax=Mergibacter septicus TaxID=221402 RepID=A0A8E3MGE8_9PAST|nr:L-cystine transporter [Mergibacter septicus]AWX15634.1 L-cystine transporter [Mergibacter septicus]QDJ14888.1 L-cystine transporter [Mergibacter septicus]UTU47687.1 L-cystine transporter [Mergibacter septicus]WMR96708.1 L-cystine transporter [Mergibacter septicus]